MIPLNIVDFPSKSNNGIPQKTFACFVNDDRYIIQNNKCLKCRPTSMRMAFITKLNERNFIWEMS